MTHYENLERLAELHLAGSAQKVASHECDEIILSITQQTELKLVIVLERQKYGAQHRYGMRFVTLERENVLMPYNVTLEHFVSMAAPALTRNGSHDFHTTPQSIGLIP